MARRILAVALIGLGAFVLSCQEGEKKAPAQVYEPPKLRSEAERSTKQVKKVRIDVRVTLRMTKEQVEEVQGKPERVDVISYPGSQQVVEDWRYPAIENGCRKVLFTDGRVTLLRECVGAANTNPEST